MKRKFSGLLFLVVVLLVISPYAYAGDVCENECEKQECGLSSVCNELCGVCSAGEHCSYGKCESDNTSACVPDPAGHYGRIVVSSTYNYKLPYYRNYPLNKYNDKVESAIIVIHGTNRNADDYYSDMFCAAQTANALPQTLIIAPKFLVCKKDDENCDEYLVDPDYDKVETDEIFWNYNSYWKKGNKSSDGDGNGKDYERKEQYSSFAIIDMILLKLEKSENFPNLKNVVITGHSAGGQFTQRYSIGQIENYSFALRFVPMNPSSYMYLNDQRWNTKEGEFGVPEKEDQCLDAADNPTYNDYKYGPESMNAYMTRLPSLIYYLPIFFNKNIIYMIGEKDTVRDIYLDTSCPAELQGRNRLDRWAIFTFYIDKYYDFFDKQTNVHVPGVGHDHEQMFLSNEGKAVLFNNIW